MRRFLLILMVLFLLCSGAVFLLVGGVDTLGGGRISATWWDIFEIGPFQGGWGPDTFWCRILLGSPDVDVRQRLWAAEWETFECVIWKKPASLQVGMPTWVCGILLLLSGLMLKRRLRKGNQAEERICRHCEHELSDEDSGICPECRLPVEIRKPRGSFSMVLDIIPWNIMAPLIMIPIILGAAGYTILPYYRTIADTRIGEAPAEVERSEVSIAKRFSERLSRVARMRLEHTHAVISLLKMMDEHEEVRLWIASHYASLHPTEQHILMGIIRNHASEKTWPEIGEVLNIAIRKDMMAIWACQALEHYDIPLKKTLLLVMIQRDAGEYPYHVRSGMRFFIPIYGSEDIEIEIQQSLQLDDWSQRAVTAAIVFALGDGRQRDDAYLVLIEAVACKDVPGADIAELLFELNSFEICVRQIDELLEKTPELIEQMNADDAVELSEEIDEYQKRCAS